VLRERFRLLDCAKAFTSNPDHLERMKYRGFHNCTFVETSQAIKTSQLYDAKHAELEAYMQSFKTYAKENENSYMLCVGGTFKDMGNTNSVHCIAKHVFDKFGREFMVYSFSAKSIRVYHGDKSEEFNGDEALNLMNEYMSDKKGTLIGIPNNAGGGSYDLSFKNHVVTHIIACYADNGKCEKRLQAIGRGFRCNSDQELSVFIQKKHLMQIRTMMEAQKKMLTMDADWCDSLKNDKAKVLMGKSYGHNNTNCGKVVRTNVSRANLKRERQENSDSDSEIIDPWRNRKM
jgi:hypothetical protein